MKKTLFSAFSIVLMLLAFASCSNEADEPKFTGDIETVAKNLNLDSLVTEVLAADATGVSVEYKLAVDSTRAAEGTGNSTLSATASLSGYRSGSYVIVDGTLTYLFSGTVSGNTFTAESICTVSTTEPLSVDTGSGNVVVTINDENADAQLGPVDISEADSNGLVPAKSVKVASVKIAAEGTVTVGGEDVIVYTSVLNADELKTGLTDGGYYRLTDNITLSPDGSTASPVVFSNDASIDLDGHTLTSEFIVNLEDASWEISNGTLISNITGLEDAKNRIAIGLKTNSSLVLDNVDYKSNIVALFLFNNENNPTLRIINGSSVKTTEAYYAIGTNATEPNSSRNVTLDIIDSTVSSAGSKDTNGDNTAILFNVNGTVTIENSEITGDRHGLILRGGNNDVPHRIVNSTITANGVTETFDEIQSGYPYLYGNWASGNGVPQAALIIGNRTQSAYRHNIKVELENADINGQGYSYCDIYVWENHTDDGYNQEISVSGSCRDITNVNNDMHGAEFNVRNTKAITISTGEEMLKP